jgi:hypothetical protein
MIRAGNNAKLDDDGYALVARMGDTEQMKKWILRFCERVVGAGKDKLTDAGKIEEIQLVAARCFRKGKPIMTCEQLRNYLETVMEIEGTKQISEKDLVLVDERRLAVVNRLLPNDELEIYDSNHDFNPLEQEKKSDEEAVQSLQETGD